MTGFDAPPGDPAALKAAIRQLGLVAGDLRQDLSATTSAVRAAAAQWTGTRRDDFVDASGGIQVQLRIAADGCDAAIAALDHYASALQQGQETVASLSQRADSVRTAAERSMHTINPSSADYNRTFQRSAMQVGQLSMQAADAKSAVTAAAHRAADALDALTDKIVPVSSRLTAADIRRQVDSELGLTGLNGAATQHLSTATAWLLLDGAQRAAPSGSVGVDGTVDWTTALGMPAVPPPGTSPAGVALWWNNLSPTEQDDVLTHRAAAAGNLDGIPVLDRDFANRRNLVAIQTSLRLQLAELQANEPTKYTTAYQGYREYQMIMPGWEEWNDKRGALQARLDGMDQVGKVLASQGPAPYFLIGLQDTGHGRAIISTGNPDTATNVATYVPGMGTTLTGIIGGVNRSNLMYNAAHYAGSTSTAAVTWYGYDAPQSLGPAAHEDDARKGALLLDSFVTGLRVTHDGTFHSTVVSHSYGTTVTGMAASHGNTLDVDDVAFVASPGVTVDHVDDLHLTGGEPGSSQHVYATTAEYDPIRLGEGINGGVPRYADFGSHVFKSDPDKGAWFTLGWNLGAHSAYWDRGNPSLRSLGMIVAGIGQEAK